MRFSRGFVNLHDASISSCYVAQQLSIFTLLAYQFDYTGHARIESVWSLVKPERLCSKIPHLCLDPTVRR